jgi:hypothetical protein
LFVTTEDAHQLFGCHLEEKNVRYILTEAVNYFSDILELPLLIRFI